MASTGEKLSSFQQYIPVTWLDHNNSKYFRHKLMPELMKFSSTAQYMIANNSKSETTAQDIDLVAFIPDIGHLTSWYVCIRKKCLFNNLMIID